MADSDGGKVFVGGLSWETSAEALTDYFSRYGEVTYSIVAKDRETGNPRGFAFVTFSDPSAALKAIDDRHEIDGRLVEVKRAKPKQVVQNHHEESGLRTKKIFVGGLSANVTEEAFKRYFEKFGEVTDVVVMYDSMTNRPRGFGFITFDSEDVVERITSTSFHVLDGKYVEVKKAVPKEVNRNHASSSNGDGFAYPQESYWPEHGCVPYYPNYGGYYMAGPVYSSFGYGYGFPYGYGPVPYGPPVYPMSRGSGTGSFGVSYGAGGRNYDEQRSRNVKAIERNQ